MEAKQIKDLMEAYDSVYTQSNVKEDFENWVNSLVKEGYDLSDYTWNEMYEIYEEYESDIFDVILEHLVAEGYADTNENALVIMANMSEEWKQSIVEQMTDGPTDSPSDEKKPLTGEGPKKPKEWKPTGPKLRPGQRPSWHR